jgi:hypothetical protein
VANELEALFADQMLNVAARTSEEVVDADNFRALCQQAIAKVRAEKAGATSHHNTLLKMHRCSSTIGTSLWRWCIVVTRFGVLG